MTNTVFKDIVNYINNPFDVEGVIRKHVKHSLPARIITDAATGEAFSLEPVAYTEERWHDPVKYVKLYKQDLITNLVNLTVPANNLFYLIAEMLDINAEKVCITEADFVERLGYSPGSKRLYYRAVLELIDKNIIAKVTNTSRCYWVNPNIIFNGDRTKLMGEIK